MSIATRSQRRIGTSSVSASIALCLACMPTALPAQVLEDQEPYLLDTIIIEGRSAAADAFDAPESNSVIEGQALQEISPIDTNQGVARRTPNFNLVESGGPYTNTGVIRGVGSLFVRSPFDTSVTFNVGGVPQSAFGLPPTILDLEAVTVTRGPQGNAGGRASQAGSVDYHPNRPSFDTELLLRGELGNDGWHLGEIIANAPLIDEVLAGRLALQYSSRSGDIPNVVLGGNDGEVRVGAARGSLLFAPDAGTSGLLTFNYGRNDDTIPLFISRDADCFPCSGLNPRNSFERENLGVSLHFDHDFDGFRFASITSIARTTTDQVLDLTDGLILDSFGYPEESLDSPNEDVTISNLLETSFFHEVRLSAFEDEPVQWTVGMNTYQSRFDTVTDGTSVNDPTFAFYSGWQDNAFRLSSYSAFADAAIPLVDRLNLLTGLRLTHENKDARYRYFGSGAPGTVSDYIQDARFSDTYLTGRVGLSFDWTEQTTVYASVSRGAVTGGTSWTPYNIPTGSDEPLFPTSTSWSYEAGLKSRLLDDRVAVNASIFYNDVKDGHLLAFDASRFAYVTTAFDYETYGGELEVRAEITPNLALSGGLGYTIARLKNIPVGNSVGAIAGNDVPNVPRLTANIGAEYRAEAAAIGLAQGEIFGSASYQFVGARAADVSNAVRMPSYGIVNARLGWENDGASVYVFGNNLFDERYIAGAGSYGPGADFVRVGTGRTIGVGASVRF